MANEKYPFEIEIVPGVNYVQVGPKKYYLTKAYEKECWNLYNLEARKNDVWILGLPRSGTTLTQELLWLIANDLDYKKASETILDDRISNLDHILISGKGKLVEASPDDGKGKTIFDSFEKSSFQQLRETQERRFIKSHLPISLLNPQILSSGCKVVFCARNPKDLIVSNFHTRKYYRPNEVIEFRDFWKSFKNNQVIYTPFFEHLKEGWNQRNNPNFLFLFYENTIKDKKLEIKKIAAFLGKNLDDSQLQKLEDHVKIENFRKNKSVNREHWLKSGLVSDKKEHQFIRKGDTGGWKNYFTPELNAEADKWIEENLKGTDLVFPQEK